MKLSTQQVIPRNSDKFECLPRYVAKAMKRRRPSKGDKKVPSIKRGGLRVILRGGRGVLLERCEGVVLPNVRERRSHYMAFRRRTLERGKRIKSPFEGGVRGMALLLILILIPFWSFAQQSAPANKQLDQYLQQAAQNNPELKAQFNEYRAALQQVPQVTALPDPKVAFDYFIQSTETRVGPLQARFEVNQSFPWFGTLGARGDAATQTAKATFETFQETRNTLFFKVKKTWYKLYYIDQSIQITRENIDILETFESLATSRYETAQASQVDVLRVQIDKEDLITQLALLQDSKETVQQRLDELINWAESRQADVPDTLAAQELPLPVPELKQRTLRENPRLTKLDFEAASARSAIEVAQKEGLPKFGLGADYIITNDGPLTPAPPDNGKDVIVGQIDIRIPLYRKKYRAQKKQAQLRLRAVQDRQEATQNSLLTTFEETLRDFYDAQRRVSLYKDIQIQRTRQALDILTEEYATAATDFEELLRLQRKLLEFQLAREKAIVDQNTAVAFTEYLYGKYNVNPEEINNQ